MILGQHVMPSPATVLRLQTVVAREVTTLDRCDVVTNDEEATERARDALRAHFGAARVTRTGAASASEDFGSFGAEWHAPSVFWFAPVIHPTLETGVQTLVVATCAWLSS